MTALSIKSAIAGWVGAIAATLVVLGFYVGGYSLEGSLSEIISGIGFISLYTAFLSGIVIFVVWLFILLPLSFMLTRTSWLLRFPQSLAIGAGTILYLAFAMVASSEKFPFLLIGTFTGMATAFYATLATTQQNKTEHASPANRHPFGTSDMLPADPATRAGSTPEASGDS